MKKIVKKIGQGVLAIALLMICGGILYQKIGTQIDEWRYPAPGTLIDVGGYKMHLHSIGSGGPAVVLDTGLGGISANWGLVQPEIAKFTQVVSYDRAGTGWSDKSPHPRTSRQMVQELHTLLHTADIPGPYILVGHSFGGINVQLFASTYPEEVAGIVLVDSSHEQQLKRLPPTVFDNSVIKKPLSARLAAILGMNRLFAKRYLKGVMPYVPKDMRNIHIALCSTVKYMNSLISEDQNLEESFKQLEEADQTVMADKPCIVLTAGAELDISRLGLTEEMQQSIHQMFVVWSDLQGELAAKFHHSQHFVADESDHMIPINQPEAIVEAVYSLIFPEEDSAG